MATHIKIGDISPRIQYTGDGIQTAFTYPFPVFTDADIETYEDATLKTLTTDYAVSGTGNSNGGTITFITAPASGSVVTIRRNIAIQRTSDFQVAGEFRAEIINDELDYQTAALQQVGTDIARALQLGPTDSGATTLPDKASRASRYLGFDVNGDPIATDAAGPIGPPGPAGNMDGANNLNELTSLPTARTNLGLVIGTDVLAPAGDGSALTGIVSGATVAEKSNIMLNAFRIEVNGGLAVQNMVDGVSDTFTDQTGIDTVNSLNAAYDVTNNLYNNGTPALSTFIAATSTGSNLSTYNFTGQTLGTGDIVVTVSNAGPAPSSVTVDGVSATLVKFQDSPSTGAFTSIYRANGIINATGTITVVFGVAASRCGIATYLMTNADTVVDSTAGIGINSGTLLSTTINVPASGTMIMVASGQQGGSENRTLAGVTEAYDVPVDTNNWQAGGSTEFAAVQTGLTVSASTITSQLTASLAAASWGSSVTTPLNMTLISNATTALSTPTSAFIVIEEEDVGAVTPNTDLKAYASRDGGTTWTVGTLALATGLTTGRILTTTIDVSAQPAGTLMKYKIETLNAKQLKIHSVALQWS